MEKILAKISDRGEKMTNIRYESCDNLIIGGVRLLASCVLLQFDNDLVTI